MPALTYGLSPRVRGNRHDAEEQVAQVGSIPARAGEPILALSSGSTSSVYPRACGGTGPEPGETLPKIGLSPRVRGNRMLLCEQYWQTGSIPARAGEPSIRLQHRHSNPVYPRACGGTGLRLATRTLQRGLSPRVRGNHPVAATISNPEGSIPARAGEPCANCSTASIPMVYPRACGGTHKLQSRAHRSKGLSPRVRGNHLSALPIPDTGRSIPARAGEPLISRHGDVLRRVYPRACGGTAGGNAGAVHLLGLSPRVRGNHLAGIRSVFGRRSIPARAGEPDPVVAIQAQIPVYPRACGGTRRCRRAGLEPDGLSPRVRGNRRQPESVAVLAGSIPARAGEPRTPGAAALNDWVYPRACGGTAMGNVGYLREAGLSPRVRGNPSGRSCPRSGTGSIPARAGEPVAGSSLQAPDAVYPRACGGTTNER